MKAHTLLRLRSPSWGTRPAWLHDLKDWLEIVKWEDCLSLLEERKHQIPAVWVERQKFTERDWSILRKLKRLHPDVHLLACLPHLTVQEYQELVQSQLFWQVGTPETPPEVWKSSLSHAIEEFKTLQRHRQRATLNRVRNLKLLRMTSNLEAQVRKRTKKLFVSTQRLEAHEKQLERFRSLLVDVNSADDVRSMYTCLSRQLAHFLPYTELSIVMQDWTSPNLIAMKTRADGSVTQDILTSEEAQVILATFNGLEPLIMTKTRDVLRLLRTQAFALKQHASVLFFPLSLGNSRGAILFGTHEWQGFHHEHIETLLNLQAPLSVALERVSTIGSLKALQEQWEATFRAFDSPLFITQEDGTVVRTNTVAEELIRELPDLPELVRIFPRNRESGPESILKTAGREFQLVERSFVHRERLLRLVHLRELTEEKNLLQQLLQSEKLASVGLLSERVAHELNNPLAGIMALSQLLQDDSDPSLAADLKEIEKACARCKHIIENLVQFSRSSPHRPMTVVDMNKVVQETLTLAWAALSGLELKTEFKDSLPSVLGRFQELQQVMFNLIQNASHSMQGKGTLLLTTDVSHDRQRVTFSIRDTGEGIPDTVRTRLFEPFFTTKRAGVGTGLGLSICKKIISEHEGSIDLIYSELGRGSEFRVTLPALKDPVCFEA